MTPSKVVAEGKVVGIYYTLKDDDGQVLDTNRKGGRPLAFLVGKGNIVPGLEKALDGMSKDEFKEVDVAPEDAYGVHKPELVQQVPRDQFPAEVDIQPGMRFNGQDAEGRARQVNVTAVEGNQITVDHNHALAGKTLHFDVTIAGVRDATEEEVQHGHPHGPGGHQH